MKPASYVLAATLLMLIVSPSPIQAAFLVVPNAQATTTGNDSSGNLAGGPMDVIFQEDFGRGQFSSVPGSLLITSFAWRIKPGTGSIAFSDTSLSVHISTSQFAPNSNGGNTLITPTFADNIGPDNALVLASGPGTLFSPGCTGVGPCPFDIVFTLNTPFLYNPSKGFLLVDFRANGLIGVGTGQFDVEGLFPPGGGPVASVSGLAGSTTGNVDLSGNIVRFGYVLVTPEPGSLALMLIGVVAFAVRQRRRS
jgi:hypothetical protein